LSRTRFLRFLQLAARRARGNVRDNEEEALVAAVRTKCEGQTAEQGSLHGTGTTSNFRLRPSPQPSLSTPHPRRPSNLPRSILSAGRQMTRAEITCPAPPAPRDGLHHRLHNRRTYERGPGIFTLLPRRSFLPRGCEGWGERGGQAE
jgi:hypothetical protein